jgi:hypothetical protein
MAAIALFSEKQDLCCSGNDGFDSLYNRQIQLVEILTMPRKLWNMVKGENTETV